MNIISWIRQSICLLFLLSLISCNSETKKNQNNDLISGHWQFTGHLGNYIDKISHKRILDQDKWDMIYPETEQAFGLREDDVNYPKNGLWRGEFWGKYILSVIAAARYYGSEELKERVANAVKGLSQYQDANGYIGTYSHSDFLEGNNWNVWSRKYTLWGLVESWELTGDRSVLEIAKRFTDHLISEVGLGKEDIVKTGNFYGMPSSSILQPMVKLYKATGEEKYLKYSEYIVTQWARHPEGLPDILNKGLEGKPVHLWFSETDPYKWAKGYEFTSCVEGLLELYTVTSNESYLEAAKNIHSVLVEWERTPVGSVSFNDKYVGSSGIINTVSEICDAVYWNRLSYKLYEQTGDAKYVDEIERTLYNSLLCAYNLEGDWGLRRLRMSHVHIPAMNHFLEHHQCCTDNLPRGLYQAAETVLMRNGDKVFFSLYNQGQGEINLASGNQLGIKCKGDYLDNGEVVLELSMDQPEKFKLELRNPYWSEQTSIEVNGEKQNPAEIKGWIDLDRKWQAGDKIRIEFDVKIRMEQLNTKKSEGLFHPVEFYEEQWANICYKSGTSSKVNEKYEHIKKLDVSSALPTKDAITFFYGPLALCRDKRITNGDIFSSVCLDSLDQPIGIKKLEASIGIWKEFELEMSNKKKVRFCDFSSAGNTWDDQSLFNTWCLIDK